VHSVGFSIRIYHDARSPERQLCGHILLLYDFELFYFTQVGPQTNQGTLSSFTLILHGTKDRPAYLNDGPRRYNQDYNRVQKKVSGLKIIFFVGLSLVWAVAGGGGKWRMSLPPWTAEFRGQ